MQTGGRKACELVLHEVQQVSAQLLPAELLGRSSEVPGELRDRQHVRVETKDNALAMLRDAQSRITQAVHRVDDSRLDEAFPDESYRDVFPTIRHAITQVLAGHTAYHIGQLTVWRRAMGLPPLGRVFE